MTTSFEVRLVGIEYPLMTGQTNHIPRLDESILVHDLLYTVSNIIWEFNRKHQFGSMVTIIVKPPADTSITSISIIEKDKMNE